MRHLIHRSIFPSTKQLANFIEEELADHTELYLFLIQLQKVKREVSCTCC